MPASTRLSLHGPSHEHAAPQILLFAAEPAASRLGQALASEGDVEIVSDPQQCSRSLHAKTFSLVLLEDSISSGDPALLERLTALAGDALVLELNLALAGPARVLRQVRAARMRRDSDREKARESAVSGLRKELIGAVSGLLLESQLTLQQAEPELAPALEHLVRLTEALCRNLQD